MAPRKPQNLLTEDNAELTPQQQIDELMTELVQMRNERTAALQQIEFFRQEMSKLMESNKQLVEKVQNLESNNGSQMKTRTTRDSGTNTKVTCDCLFF